MVDVKSRIQKARKAGYSDYEIYASLSKRAEDKGLDINIDEYLKERGITLDVAEDPSKEMREAPEAPTSWGQQEVEVCRPRRSRWDWLRRWWS